MTSEDFWKRYRSETSILFVSNPTYEILHRMAQQTNWQPYQVDYLNAEVFQRLRTGQYPACLKDRLDKTMEIYRQSAQDCFSDLLTASGLTHGTGVWEENGEELLKTSTASMDQLIAFREDVFYTILGHMPTGTGVGLPRKLMNEVTMGRINRNGMDEADETALQSMGVSQWYIDSMKKILYLFPKSHSVQFEQVSLIAIWYDIHYPELSKELGSTIEEV